MNTNLLDRATKISRNIFFVKTNIVAPKNISLRYILYRIFRPVLKIYNRSVRRFIFPDSPWTSPASILIFKRLLNKDMVGFEFGSGSSTIFFSNRIKKLVSLEHSKKWYEEIHSTLEKEHISNVEYHYVPPSNNNMKNGELVTFNGSGVDLTKTPIRTRYYQYFQFIKDYPDQSFDFILIDGRARVECALNSISKLKPNGMMILDNSERKRYRPVHEILKDWPKVHTTTGLTDTTIWFKP